MTTLVRSAVYQGLFYLWTAALGLAYLPLLAAPRRIVLAAARLWCGGVLWLLRRCVRLTYEVRGGADRPAGPALYAIKHQSAWETLVLMRLFPDPAVVIKKELFAVPLFGWQIWRLGMIPVDRKGAAAALRRMVALARKRLEDGRDVVVFPEGTRTPPGAARPYHPGIAALYRALDVPVVPVALDSGRYWGRREFVKRPGRIVVSFLAPIPPGLERAAFMATLRERIETETAALLAEAARSDPCTSAN